jgi:hypothetical protein
MKRLFAALLWLVLSACSVIATKDIDQAISLAEAANDTEGIACLQSQRLIFGVEPIGLFTLAEQARLIQRALVICAGVIPQLSMPIGGRQ